MNCLECAAELPARRPNQPGPIARYCSDRCYNRAWKRRSRRGGCALNRLPDELLASLPQRELVKMGVRF